MQHSSFLMGCNYSNRDITTDASLFPVQDIDTVLTNIYGLNVNVDDPFSLFYCDLYIRQLKERFKHTMLVHESVFESQIHELHRLYWRQKELMMEMERTRRHEALYLNSTFPSLRTHWMNPSFSAYQTRTFPYEENIPNRIEAVEKPEKVVLGLELPVFEYDDREVERGLMNGEVHEVANFLKEQSLESGNQLNKLQLDLNEPAKLEEHSDYVFSQFLSPPVTSNETGQESDKKNEVEDSAKESNWMNEAQGQPSSVKCRAGCEIDLNMSPLSFEEEVDIVKEFETGKPQECLSVSLHGKHVSKQSRVVVQALPCLNSILLLNKRLMRRSSRPRKKVKLGPVNKTFKGSDLDLHSSAEATSESQGDRVTMGKGSSSSLSKVKSARNRTNLGKKRRCKPQMKSSNGHKVAAKKKRKKSRRISLVTEGNYQEISAAEAIVDMSRKSGRETSDCITTSLGRNLLWLAEISSSVIEDYELDDFEPMTLQLTEMKLEDHKTILRSNSADNKTAVSRIVLRKQRRSRTKRKRKDYQHDEVIEKLVEVYESKWDCGFPKNKNKSRSSPPKPIEAFTSNWGAIKKRRRGSRIPAAGFQHMIIDQVV